MERYEVVNRALMPADHLIGAGFGLMKRVGWYDPFKERLTDSVRKALLSNFRNTHKLEVVGEDNLPASGGCIVAANHASWLDAQVLAVATTRRLHFIAKSDFREWPLLRRLLELTDSIYIKRGGDDRGLQDVAAAIAEGKAVVIFPEGTIPGEEDVPRWEVERDTGLLRGHSGVVRLALATGAPIVPIGLSGTGAAFPPEAYPRLQLLPLPKPAPITVKIGKAIRFTRSAKPVSRTELAGMTKKVMTSISALVDHERGFEPMKLPIEPRNEPGPLPKIAFSRSPDRREAGTGRAPLGVLVLHGFTSDIHCVDALKAPLDQEGLPYRFPILRGHGTRFQDMEGTSARDWYGDAESTLLDLAREVDRVVVVGLSMGGLVALELAAKHRDKVAGVVTVAAALKFADPLAVLTPLLSRVVKFWPSPNAYNDPELRRKENRNYPKFATSAFSSLFAYARAIPNVLSFVKAPILILQSRKDQVISPSSAKAIHDKVSSKDRTVIWFERSGHEMLLDMERDDVLASIMKFVRRIRENG